MPWDLYQKFSGPLTYYLGLSPLHCASVLPKLLRFLNKSNNNASADFRKKIDLNNYEIISAAPLRLLPNS